MTNLRKELKNCKHPNSRRTKALSKKARRQNNKHKSRLRHAIKSNLMGERLSWFLDQIGEERQTPLTPGEFSELIELYLHRFDEELEQISFKQSVSKNNSKHVARENVIRITLEKDKSEFYSGGIELVDLCDEVKFKSLLDWDGSAINVQHLKLDLISKNKLERMQEHLKKDCATNSQKESDKKSVNLPSNMDTS